MFSYIHIPFCRQKCTYCKFALTPQFDDAKIHRYLAFLHAEIEHFFQTNPASGPLRSIYFGGGTPSVLTPDSIASVIEVFRSHGSFDPEIEITVEANPEDVNREFIAGLEAAGVNRVSLGVQTLRPASLLSVGRSDPSTISRALDWLSESSIRSLNIDLILGLPYGKRGESLRDLESLHDRYRIDHTSVYILEKGKYPPEYVNALSEEEIRGEYAEMADFLEQRWLRQYEVSNFARTGHASWHNRAYWNHSEVRGFGLAAASFLQGRRFENAPSFSGYYQGEIVSDELLSPEALRIERILFGLRTFSLDPLEISEEAKLEAFLAQGLLAIEENRLFPTLSWIFLLDHIIAELI